MPLAKALLAEFEHEMKGTRRTLERVPDDKLDWKPHAKSFSMGVLASHLAEIPGWVVPTLSEESLDLAPPGKPPYKTTQFSSRAEILKAFDRNVASAQEALGAATDEQLFVPWSLLKGGHPIFTLPRVGAMRGFIFNHNVHHRAQLGLYLRLNDIAVPSIYGPSADEQP